LDREYLEDYQQKEKAEQGKFFKKIQEGKFDIGKDRYPPDDRFVKLQRPVTVCNLLFAHTNCFWAQVPFSTSLVLSIPPLPQHQFEDICCKVPEIPKIIDFIKETGRLQIALTAPPTYYEGLDYFDPFFVELKPPFCVNVPLNVFWDEKDLEKAAMSFTTLASVRYRDYEIRTNQQPLPLLYESIQRDMDTYMLLKLGHYAIVDDIEDLLIDNPRVADLMFGTYRLFVVDPLLDVFRDSINYSLEAVKMGSQVLPLVYQPEKIRFPAEIGKFLMKDKLTNAPYGLEACRHIIDQYNAYDLEKVQTSLNEAIVANHFDVLGKNSQELSEILDNMWNDPTIPKKIKNLRRGIPISIAAIGPAISAFAGGVAGFLSGLGFAVGSKFLDVEIEGLSERIAKFFSRSYQANVYDFKKKYKGKIGE
jgi:hypothetical protein